MNLTNYIHTNDLHVLYYAAADKSARDFLVALYTTGQSYSDRHNYHVSKNTTAMDLMIHPDLHSIEVYRRDSAFSANFNLLCKFYVKLQRTFRVVVQGSLRDVSRRAL